jgi:hypothetical protein
MLFYCSAISVELKSCVWLNFKKYARNKQTKVPSKLNNDTIDEQKIKRE